MSRPSDDWFIEYEQEAVNVSSGFLVMEVDVEPDFIPAALQDFSGLPVDSVVATLHANFLDYSDDLAALPNLQRGRQAAWLLLTDLVDLAEQVEAGRLPDAVGFMGTSPLARPQLLRRFGASVRPAKICEFAEVGISNEYLENTGAEPGKRPIHQFFFSRQALIDSVEPANAFRDFLYRDHDEASVQIY